VIADFLTKYDTSSLPPDQIAQNVLQEMGVPSDKCTQVLQLIIAGARDVWFLTDLKGKVYVDLQGTPLQASPGEDSDEDGSGDSAQELVRHDKKSPPPIPPKPNGAVGSAGAGSQQGGEAVRRRVFITHGKNRSFIDTIKNLLGFGELEAIVSVDHSSVSQPVPEKVISEMRSCGAAIIHVDAETKCKDEHDAEYVVLNPNVLIEIGAAMALYGKRFILLTRAGIQLPSNLQGVFEVRYTGDTLSADEAMKLLGSIKDIKNHPIPARYMDEQHP